jgi:uncharacterized protein (TIGR03437 family)
MAPAMEQKSLLGPSKEMSKSMRNLHSLALAVLLICGLPEARGAAYWEQHNPQNIPQARDSHAIVYDSAHDQVVLFGGHTARGVVNDTWVWDGSNWKQKFPDTSPPARVAPALVYDSAHSQVLLFGGLAGTSPLDDTWVWDGSKWMQKFPSTSPPARYFHGMAYDSAHNQVVLFGGTASGNDSLNDTWAWDGASWAQKFPVESPPARHSHGMAYDSAHRQIVLFGGTTGGADSLNDTWVSDGSNWAQKFPATSPRARYSPGMAYDSARNQIVLFGGTNAAANYFSDTWQWNGYGWTQEFMQTGPAARALHAMAYNSTSSLTDTWTSDGEAVSTGPLITQIVSAVDYGGFPEVGPGSWVEIHGSNLASQTRGWSAADFNGNEAPTALDGVTVTIGGQAAFVEYISPIQVNAQLPSTIPTGGTLAVTVTTAGAMSSPVNVTVTPAAPGLLAPASFQLGGHLYVVAQASSDGAYILPVGSFSPTLTRTAKPGETLMMYGIGFGSVSPSIAAGEIATQYNELSRHFQLFFGGTEAQVTYSGLAPNYVGLYQFNVVVPAVPDSNFVPLTFILDGVAGVQTLFTAVHH